MVSSINLLINLFTKKANVYVLKNEEEVNFIADLQNKK